MTIPFKNILSLFLKDANGCFSMMRLVVFVTVVNAYFIIWYVLIIWTVFKGVPTLPENFLISVLGLAGLASGFKAWQKFAEVQEIVADENTREVQ